MSVPTLMTMPKLGLTMTEGTVAEWRVRPGDHFRKGDIILVVETDKIANEIEASEDGRVEEILCAEGSVVPVGAPVARFAGGAKGANVAPAPAPAMDEPQQASTPHQTTAAPAHRASGDQRVVATPLARRIARDHDLDLARVNGSGPGGRVKAVDVRGFLDQAPAIPAPVAASPAASAVDNWSAATGFEKSLASRLTTAKRDVPHFYLSTEVNAGPLLDLRQGLPQDENGKRPTITHLITAAVARTLVAIPSANRIWRDDGFVTFPTIDVGLAVHTEHGLMAPVLRDVGQASLGRIASLSTALFERARSSRLGADDVGGGAITISNAGMHDVTQMIPIITPGQSIILGVGSVRQTFRPDASGQPELRREITLTMSFDHRVFDGVSGLAILNRLRHFLETPLTILI